jgi:hypothetical protein
VSRCYGHGEGRTSARGQTRLDLAGVGHQLGCGSRPVQGGHLLVGKPPKEARQQGSVRTLLGFLGLPLPPPGGKLLYKAESPLGDG